MEIYKQESFLGSAPGNSPHKGAEGKQDGTGGEYELWWCPCKTGRHRPHRVLQLKDSSRFSPEEARGGAFMRAHGRSLEAAALGKPVSCWCGQFLERTQLWAASCYTHSRWGRECLGAASTTWVAPHTVVFLFNSIDDCKIAEPLHHDLPIWHCCQSGTQRTTPACVFRGKRTKVKSWLGRMTLLFHSMLQVTKKSFFFIISLETQNDPLDGVQFYRPAHQDSGLWVPKSHMQKVLGLTPRPVLSSFRPTCLVCFSLVSIMPGCC